MQLNRDHTMNFLIIDDNRLLNRFLVTYLREKEHNCSAISDATKAVEWLKANPCDAIILDIAMPKIDGLTLIKLIRAEHKDLPIIMFTGMGYDEELMQAARTAGANGYVSKVLGPAEIYAALLRVLQKQEPEMAVH
jgi:DNA-binding response OmpR family regulator